MTTPLLSAFVGAPEPGNVYNVDALTLLRALPTGSVDLIATDPPFNIDKAAWDSWPTLDAFIAWLDAHLREFKRVLKPNGSLYLFCATKYAARVELAVGAHFEVLNTIRWRKEAGWHKQAVKNELRGYFDASESIVFAEQFGADLAMLHQNDALSGFLFEPLRAYLDDERRRANVSFEAVRQMVGCAPGSGLPSHWFTPSQWILPTAEQYLKLRIGFNRKCGVEYLRREYEYLRREYEYLRRPFFASADAPYTDVWDFRTVNTYTGKHICEKPLDMCQHIIRVSSRPGALLLDPFCGSGNMLRAAFVEGRQFVGGDLDLHWATRARNWATQPFDVPLFAEVPA